MSSSEDRIQKLFAQIRSDLATNPRPLQATSGRKYRVLTIGRLTLRWRKST